MSIGLDDNALSNLQKMTSDNRVSFFPTAVSPVVPNATDYSSLRCGSTGGTTSDDDVDNEVINVTDDDDVVMTTTDSTVSTDITLKVKIQNFYFNKKNLN